MSLLAFFEKNSEVGETNILISLSHLINVNVDYQYPMFKVNIIDTSSRVLGDFAPSVDVLKNSPACHPAFWPQWSYIIFKEDLVGETKFYRQYCTVLTHNVSHVRLVHYTGIV